MADTVQQARLRALLAAEVKVLKSQEWQDGTVKNRRADLKTIQAEIATLRAAGVTLAEEATESATVARRVYAKRVILRDD